VFALRPLRRDALGTVITGPARVAGIEIEQQLVDELVGDTGTGDALPLLAFTLEQLVEGVGRGGQLSAMRYEQLGGVRGALVYQANAALADAHAASGRSADEVLAGLLRLVTVDEQSRPTGWRVDRNQLPEPVRLELDAFVARRLLTTDTDNGTVVVGVTHEAFLSAWPPLAAAIAAAASALRMRRAVEQAAADWDDSGRATTRLWERGQLAAATTDIGARIRSVSGQGSPPSTQARSMSGRLLSGWLPGRSRLLVTDKVELSPRARAFLHASIRLDRHRRRRATTILSVLLVLATTAAGVAIAQQRAAQWQQRAAERQHRVATARGLVAQADAVRGTDPRLALLLGIAAERIHPDSETRASLVNTLTTTHYAGTLTSGRRVDSLAFAPDGHTLASGSEDGTVLLWDLSDRAHPRRLGRPLTLAANPLLSVAFASDGRTLAGGSVDGVALWDVSDRARPRQLGQPLRGPGTDRGSVAFTPDGHTLATRGGEGTALWDLSDRTHPRRLGQPLSGPATEFGSVAFAPHGHTLATTTR
jgi:hypothetical protein